MGLHRTLQFATIGMSPTHRAMVIGDILQAEASSSAPVTMRSRLRAVVPAATVARLDDHHGLDGIVTTGLVVVAMGSLLYAEAESPGRAAYAVSAVVVLALAGAFRSRTFHPTLGVVVGLAMSAALVWQLVAAEVVVPVDIAVLAAMAIASIVLLAAFTPLLAAGSVPVRAVPGVIRQRRWTRRSWQLLVRTLVVIGLGDIASACTDAAGVAPNLGLVVTGVGALLVAHGMHHAIDPRIRPARAW